MVLKKQTVWLLTMLSLIVVLAVYYVLPPAEQTDLAAIGTEDEHEQMNQTEDGKKEEDKAEDGQDEEVADKEEADKEEGTKDDEKGETKGDQEADNQDSVVNIQEVFEEEEGSVENPATTDVFAQTRTSLMESRGKQEEANSKVVSAPESSPSEVSNALDNTKELQLLVQKEEELEREIMLKGGYEDVLVLLTEGAAEINVNVSELTAEQSVQIMDIAQEKLGTKVTVAVNYVN
ncbi:SpoIIIAH-like family protein [Alkalihalobacillus pseudalcaliphilus]|uniref:SpoIIIAH-like family protein n=1 Tax=Alkalihalobacillus pseudalcaliphilus TaxID=79884 RepID=UPI00069D46B9|nr:SpoIIIAH-like family protein [Alkalihalobacillus pseudalcaliphilus]